MFFFLSSTELFPYLVRYFYHIRFKILSYGLYLSSLGNIRLRMIATKVAITTGEEAKTIVTHSGNWERDSLTWLTPMPKAAESPTIEVLR